jgi:E3 ubiquitin-protein ligase HERC2
VLVEGLEGVRSIAVGDRHTCTMTLAGDVFSWGKSVSPEAQDVLRPTIVEGFGGVRVRRVCTGGSNAYAIGEDGEVFSWGRGGEGGLLGHGDTQCQPSPKRVEALRGVRVSSVAIGERHALALAEDGLVHAWGQNQKRALLGNPDVERELLPQPVEALRGVRVVSVAAGSFRSYALADTGEVWAWGFDEFCAGLGHCRLGACPVRKPMKSFQGINVDAVAAGSDHTLALADDGSVDG